MEQENTEQKHEHKNNKTPLIIFALLLLLPLLLGGCNLILSKTQNLLGSGKNQTTTTPEPEQTDSNEMTPEEVVRQLEEAEQVTTTGPMTVEIVSPEGTVSSQSQSRYYRAEITNFPKNARGECEWLFYLDQNNQEQLYEQMTVRTTQDHCGFTSTFIEHQGKLRVKVTVTATDREGEEVISPVSAEREYTVI
jgi:hypothetical protein